MGAVSVMIIGLIIFVLILFAKTITIVPQKSAFIL